jgi:hypothetical protein
MKTMKESGLEKVTKWFENNLQWILIASAFLAVILPWTLTRTAFLDLFVLPGDVGSTIGGISQTVLGVVTVILIFLTYRSQKQELDKISNLNKDSLYSTTFINSINIKQQLLSNTALIDYNGKELKGIYSYMHISAMLREITIKPLQGIYEHYIQYNEVNYTNLDDQNNTFLKDFIKAYSRHLNSEIKSMLDFFFENTYGTELQLLVSQTGNLVNQINKFDSEEFKIMFHNFFSSSYSIAQKELLLIYTQSDSCPENIIKLNSTPFFNEVKNNVGIRKFEEFQDLLLKTPESPQRPRAD